MGFLLGSAAMHAEWARSALAWIGGHGSAARLLLFAQKAAGGAGGKAAAENPGFSMITLMGPIAIVLLYLFMFQRPQKREQMSREQMLKNLKKNDHIVTTSGIYGVVTNVQADADRVSVRVDDSANVTLRFSLGAIHRVLGDGSADKDAKKT